MVRNKTRPQLHSATPVATCLAVPHAFDTAGVRARFPVFFEKPDVLFLDNASTTQKPQTVIDCFTDFYRRDCANAGRSSYSSSTRLAARIEEARARVARFIGAKPDSICFTSGATESLNLVAHSWGLKNLKSGDEVMVCLDDHKSTVLPWFNLQATLRRFGIDIKIVPIRLHYEGDYELKSIREGITQRTRLIAITHVHHVYGLDMEVREIRKIAGSKVLISLDASQSVGHRLVNVRGLNVDFLSFSGHKMFAGNGVGVLYVRKSLLRAMAPVTVGGGMSGIESGGLSVSYSKAAAMLEAGTQNIPAILSMVSAIEFIDSIGLRQIDERVSDLTRYLYGKLNLLPGIEFSPGVARCGCHRGFGIVSFRFEQAATSDLAFLLDAENILVRTGDQCQSKTREGDDYVRVSLHLYNTESEIDRLIDLLQINLQ